MKRSKRPNHQRLNYRVLHSDGIKTVVSSSDSESDSVSDTGSQDLSNTSNKLLDPLLISRFEELSCQTNSKIQFDPVKEPITQSVSNSLEKDSTRLKLSQQLFLNHQKQRLKCSNQIRNLLSSNRHYR